MFQEGIFGREVWSENKPHLLNKLNYSPWDASPICERIVAGFHN